MTPPLHHPRDTVDRLERDHPGYQVWYVPTATSGALTWCGRRWDAPEPRQGGSLPLTAPSSGQLELLIQEDEEAESQ